MAEYQKQKTLNRQVTFREFCSADLRSLRLNQVSWRLHNSLIQQLGQFSTDRTSDWIAQAYLQLLQKLQRTRKLSNSDEPVFPYLLKTAMRVAFEELSPEPKSKYERTRRLECTSERSEIAFLDQKSVATTNFKSAFSVADDFQEPWRELSFKQRFVLEAVAKAKLNGYDLNNDELGIELGALLGSKAIKGNTIAQHKTRALRSMRGTTTAIKD